MEYKIHGTPRAGLWGAALGFFIGFAAVSLFGPMVKFFRDAGVDPVLAGLLISIPNLTGSLLRIPFSAWVDTTGGRKPFLVLLFLALAGMVGIYLLLVLNLGVQYFGLLLVFGALAGCGIATFSVGISQTSYWFKQSEQGAALGTYAGVGNLAPGIFALLLTNITLPTVGLNGSYLLWLIFLAIGIILYIRLGRNAWFFQLKSSGLSVDESAKIAKEKFGQELLPRNNIKESLGISAKTWKTWGLVAVYFTTFGGFIALTAWFPTYWQSYWGMPLGQAGLLTALYSIAASVFRIFGGKVADRFGGLRVAMVSLGLTGAGAAIVALAGGTPGAILGTLFLAVGMGVANAAVFKLVPQSVPQAIGGAAGWVGGLGAFGGFVIPNVLVRFVSRDGGTDAGYAQGFWVFLLLAVVSILILTTFRKNKKEA